MSPENENKPCCIKEEHQGHICELESQQEWDIIRQVSNHPMFRCENCGNVANSTGNLCIPAEI